MPERGSTLVKDRGTGIPNEIEERDFLVDYTAWLVETFEIEKLQGDVDLEEVVEKFQNQNS